MRGINRKNGLLALAAAAFVTAGSLFSQPARANLVFDSAGFETSPNGYSTTGGSPAGNLFQQPTSGQQFGEFEANTGSAGTVVANSPTFLPGTSLSAFAGAQAVQLTRAAGDTIGYSPFYNSAGNPNSLYTTYTTSAEIAYNALTAGTETTDGPYIGLAIYGSAGGSEIGFVGLDMQTGELVYLDTNPADAPTTLNTFAGDPTLAADTWTNVSITANFTTQTFSVTEGANTVSNLPFFQSSSSFYAGYMYGFGLSGDTDAGAGTAFFDNYQITAVPEPASLGLVGLGIVTLLGYRTRRSTVVA